MQTISLGWSPFAAKGYTVPQTAAVLRSAMNHWQVPFNLKMFGSSSPDLFVFGYPANGAWAGLNSGRRIWVDTSRRYSKRVLRMIFMHEIGHTNGLSKLPNLGHSNDPLRATLMGPNGSKFYWFAPSETNYLQSKYGARFFRPWPIKIAGRKLTIRKNYTNTLRNPVHRASSIRIQNRLATELEWLKSYWKSDAHARIGIEENSRCDGGCVLGGDSPMVKSEVYQWVDQVQAHSMSHQILAI